jgi:ribosome maturation factor RimP
MAEEKKGELTIDELAAFSKPMDRVLDKAKRFLITENPHIRYR